MNRKLQAVVVAAVLLVAIGVRAQSKPADDPAVLTTEVRLLRRAVERQAAVSVRSQMLVSRLLVQYERVKRAQDNVDRTALAAEAAEHKQAQARESLTTAQRTFANVVEEPRRSEMERDIEVLRARLGEQDREVSRLRSHRQQAEQSLEAEERAYDKLETSLAGLDQELQKAGVE